MAKAEITSSGTHAVVKLSRNEARQFKRKADKLGIGVQDLIQQSFDQHARKRFHDAFKD